MSTIAGLTIRSATADDMGVVADMIHELAAFEKTPGKPDVNKEMLIKDGFSKEPPGFHCLIAESLGDDGALVVLGYALYCPTYSSWVGRSLLLEDIYVKPEHRAKGVGAKLFDAVVQAGRLCGCRRMDWHVLSWNPAREFYHKRGAKDLTEEESWRYYRLDIN